MLSWRTFEGRLVDLNSIDHQHLSNIYYYLNFTDPRHYEDDIREHINNELKRRFNSRLLPYRPKWRFTHEINCLRLNCMLLPNNQIVYKGTLLGELI